MKAIVALVALMLVALAGTARGQDSDPCSLNTVFTLEVLKGCLKKWTPPRDILPEFSETSKPKLDNLSAKDMDELMPLINALKTYKEKAAKEAGEAAKASEAAEAAKKAAEAAEKAADTLQRAASERQKITTTAFSDNKCKEDLVICLDRDGQPYSEDEKMAPFLLPDDDVVVLALSDNKSDAETITITARNVRRVESSFKPPSTPSSDSKRATSAPLKVKELKAIVAPDSAFLEIEFKRVGGGSAEYSIRVESRRHYIEFGLMLPFAYQREVTPQGAVQYGMEPDLAFTITVSLGARSDSDPLQPKVRSWFGLMAGADLTNEVSDKRYYLGMDFSPVSGLALNAGLAILPWEYVPNPEQVPDVLTGDIEPDQRYRASFFFGARMTPEVFDTVKAAYKALNQ